MKCPHCGKPEAHFVPPSVGDPGFYICMTEAEVTEVFKRDAEETIANYAPTSPKYQQAQKWLRVLTEPKEGT